MEDRYEDDDDVNGSSFVVEFLYAIYIYIHTLIYVCI